MSKGTPALHRPFLEHFFFHLLLTVLLRPKFLADFDISMFQGRVCPVETLDERSPQDGQRYTALVQENKGEGDWDVG